MRARGLRPRRGGTTLAMTTCSVLPSVPYDAVGPPNSIFLSRLNTQPTRCPVNASPLPSRTATHDSGPTWFATPWLGGTCTRETYRFVPAHREVKILTRLPDGRNVATRQAVHGSAPCARTEVTGRWLVLPPISVGEMMLRLYSALNYSPNSARDLRGALNGA